MEERSISGVISIVLSLWIDTQYPVLMHYNGNIRHWTPTINNPTGTWSSGRRKGIPMSDKARYFPPVNFLNCYSPFHYGIYLQNTNITLCQIVNMLDV